jgi:hypothetical protein
MYAINVCLPVFLCFCVPLFLRSDESSRRRLEQQVGDLSKEVLELRRLRTARPDSAARLAAEPLRRFAEHLLSFQIIVLGEGEGEEGSAASRVGGGMSADELMRELKEDVVALCALGECPLARERLQTLARLLLTPEAANRTPVMSPRGTVTSNGRGSGGGIGETGVDVREVLRGESVSVLASSTTTTVTKSTKTNLVRK